MPKKIPIILLFMVVVGVVALFAVTEVMAFNDYGDIPKVSITNGDWIVSLLSITKMEDSIYPYEWLYEAKRISTGGSTGLNFLAMLIPDCNTTPKIQVNLDNSYPFSNYFDAGVGEPSLNFGLHNMQANVLKGTPDNQTLWHIRTNTDVKTGSTILLKTKGGPLTFEMAVPGCTRYTAYTPLPTDDVRTIKNVQIKILRDHGTGCAIGVQYSTDGGATWSTVNPTNPPIIGGLPVVDCGETIGRTGCAQECIITAAASPGWSYQFVGGAWYKVCIGYLWNATTCCKNPPNAGLPCQ